MLEKKIKFYPVKNVNEEAMPYPQPASKFIPEWYRNMDTYIHQGLGPRMPYGDGHVSNLTVKRCIPFFDAMTSGYMVTLSSDVIFVDPKDFTHRVIWTVSNDIVGTHGNGQIKDMPVPEGYDEIFKWMFYFTIKTPPGYSCMFMHPNFMYDSPFITISGVVDTDKHPVPINFPFFLKEGFMGKIEKGTPICQIIPFKRESWKMEKERFDDAKPSALDGLHSVIEKSYKTRFWSRKSYK